MVKTYDFKEVSVLFGGQQLTGFAEGDSVTVEPDADDYALQMGADGEGTRSKSNNQAATITIRLQQGSAANDILNGFRLADQVSNGGVQPLLVKDNSGRSLHFAETAWIQRAPPAGFGNEAGEREWVLRTDKMVSTFGGN